MTEIMDVSRYQGTIDWEKVKASGKVDGVMIRAMGNSAAGRPSAPYTDPQFARNYSECKRLGIPCGVYGYFKAVNREQADKELAYFKKLLTGRSFELPVAVDIEDEVQKPLGKAALTDLTAYMLSTVESWGVYALLYTGLWFGSTFLYMGGAALKPYDVWLAAYRTKKPAPGWPFGMWQYTSKARVPGVATNVDMSHAYKDYAGIISKKGLTVSGRVNDRKRSFTVGAGHSGQPVRRSHHHRQGAGHHPQVHQKGTGPRRCAEQANGYARKKTWRAGTGTASARTGPCKRPAPL